MKQNNSETGLSLLEEYTRVGMRVSGSGAEKTIAKTTEEQDILQHLPMMFRTDSHLLLELRMREIRNQMGKTNDFPLSKGIDTAGLDIIKNDEKIMQPCSRMDIASALEIISATFQISVPNDVGLNVYFEALEIYPTFVLQECTRRICHEYKYPRLPLPVEFVDRCEPLYKEHRDWLINVINALIELERFKESGGIKPSKYLLDYQSKK
jgi:hypothetical protein|tara:strand:+ start:289 stop:915 length:627 start_codon:yes stop_codon:yes gene_type:complete